MKNNFLLGAINILLSISLFIIILLPINSLHLISEKLLTILCITFFCISLISLKFYLGKNKTIYNFLQFITIIINIICIFNILNFEQTYNYYTNIVTKQYTYQEYNIYTFKKNTIYSSIDKLENKNIGILEENNILEQEYLDSKINAQKKIYKSVEDLELALKSGEIQGFMISDMNKDKLSKDIKKTTRTIYSAPIKILNNV